MPSDVAQQPPTTDAPNSDSQGVPGWLLWALVPVLVGGAGFVLWRDRPPTPPPGIARLPDAEIPDDPIAPGIAQPDPQTLPDSMSPSSIAAGIDSAGVLPAEPPKAPPEALPLDLSEAQTDHSLQPLLPLDLLPKSASAPRPDPLLDPQTESASDPEESLKENWQASLSIQPHHLFDLPPEEVANILQVAYSQPLGVGRYRVSVGRSPHSLAQVPVLLGIHGGQFLLPWMVQAVDSAWSTLTEEANSLTLEVLAATTLSAIFLDTEEQAVEPTADSMLDPITSDPMADPIADPMAEAIALSADVDLQRRADDRATIAENTEDATANADGMPTTLPPSDRGQPGRIQADEAEKGMLCIEPLS